MGWFDEQIRLRQQKDKECFSESFANIAGAVMGVNLSTAQNDSVTLQRSLDAILKYYHVKSREIPDNLTDVNEQLEFLMRPYGIMRRTVKLDKDWYKDAIGPMLAVRKEDGTAVALIPGGISGYYYLDNESGEKIKVNRTNCGLFETEAIAFYKPFPLRRMKVSDLLCYMVQTLSVSDLVLVVLATFVVTLLGLFTAKFNHVLFSDVVESESIQLLMAITIFIVCVSVSQMIMTAVKGLLMARINTKMSISVQAATMMRILSLPADFFKHYSSGELLSRANSIYSLCDLIVSAVFTTGFTSLFSLIFISQIFAYAPSLGIPALCVIGASVLFAIISANLQTKVSKKQMELASKESGLCYALISGVQKIKLAGAQKRAFARWGNLYAKEVAIRYNPPMLLKLNGVISMAITLIGTIVIYFTAVRTQVPVADYYAFHTAYGMVSGACMSLVGITLSMAQILPTIDMAKPILETVPEVSEGKKVITRVSGNIELNQVSFRYQKNMPLVLDQLSIKIHSGEYVAIVGKTGCGKSTLMRLLLGFETPEKGAVYYDGKDLSTIDLKSLRKHIGVVIQNGKLFQGDIFSNIVILAPHLTIEDAWEAAEMAGIAEDIRHMPMGMHTIISEGSGGISGGQRQRLMIARAIASKPRILMFDEATSALDNMAQKIVSDSLASLKCTRIVIAHRLSTIRECDRILVLDQGKIIEDGTYDELMHKQGFFAELVARQSLENEA